MTGLIKRKAVAHSLLGTKTDRTMSRSRPKLSVSAGVDPEALGAGITTAVCVLGAFLLFLILIAIN